MSVVLFPAGFSSQDMVVDMDIEQLTNPAVAKSSNQRAVIIPQTAESIHHGYAYLGDNLNFRSIDFYGRPLARTGDFLVVQAMPSNAFLLDAQYVLFVEEISNYNKVDAYKLRLRFGFCEEGALNSARVRYRDAVINLERSAAGDSNLMNEEVQNCYHPRRLFQRREELYLYNAPLKKWVSGDYQGPEVEFFVEILDSSPDVQWQMHMWYSWFAP